MSHKNSFHNTEELISDSPFLSELSFEKTKEFKSDIEDESLNRNMDESPFLSIYELEDFDNEASNPELEAYVEFLSELYDEEFNEEIEEMVNEALDYYTNHITETYHPDTPITSDETSQILEEYFTPFEQEFNEFVDEFIDYLEEKNVREINRNEINELIENFDNEIENSDETEIDDEGYVEYEDELYVPGFEQLKRRKKRKARRKRRRARIKGRIKKVAKKIGKGFLKVLGGPALIVFKKFMKKWGKKLLKKLIKLAKKLVPKEYRDIIDQLGKTFAKGKSKEIAFEYDYFSGIPNIQLEMDAAITNFVFSNLNQKKSNEFDELFLERLFISENNENSDKEIDLSFARNQFVRQLSRLDNESNAEPIIENYVQAILKAIKIVLKLVGRKRIVNALTKLALKLIARISKRFRKKSDRQKLQPIVRLVVDKGLKTIGFEIPEEQELETAAHSVASILEQSIAHLEYFNKNELENEELMESYVIEAFEQAVASNFPQLLSEEAYIQHPNLRESKRNGFWVAGPIKGKIKYYKKYTLPHEVEITPHMANAIESFQGIPLNVALRDRMGIPYGKTIHARIHLFELLPQGQLLHINKFEKAIPGLGIKNLHPWTLFHPLTEQAAGILLGEPGLKCRCGKCNIHSTLSYTSGLTGHRYYFIEIPNLINNKFDYIEGFSSNLRSSKIKLNINLIKNYLKTFIFLSEHDAQFISHKLTGYNGVVNAYKILSEIVEHRLNYSLNNGVSENVLLIHPQIVPGYGSGNALNLLPTIVQIQFKKYLKEIIKKSLFDYLRNNKDSFINATINPIEGITLCMYFNYLSVLENISLYLKGKYLKNWEDIFMSDLPKIKIQTKIGYWNE